MTAARTLMWPLLMSASIMAGLVLAFVGSGVLDVVGWLLAGWLLLPAAVRLLQPQRD